MQPTLLIVESKLNQMRGILWQLRSEPYAVIVRTGVNAQMPDAPISEPFAIILGADLAADEGGIFVEHLLHRFPLTPLLIVDCENAAVSMEQGSTIYRMSSSWHGKEIRRILASVLQTSRSKLPAFVHLLEDDPEMLAHKPLLDAMLENLEDRIPGLRRRSLLEAKAAHFLAGLAGFSALKSAAFVAATLAHSSCLAGAPGEGDTPTYLRAASYLSAEMVSQAGLSPEISQAILYQHENWDGSGPNSIAGSRIPILARCVRAAQFILQHREHENLIPSLDLVNGYALDPDLTFRLIGFIRSTGDALLENVLGDRKEMILPLLLRH
jgi:hypothetical protein